MLRNPFTPSEIAALPDQFFGRSTELLDIDSSIDKGSVLIEGPIAIGKSSLLARGLDELAARDAEFRVVVADPSLKTVDDVARLLLDALLQDADGAGKFRLKLGLRIPLGFEPTVEVESKEAAKDIQSGRALAALKRILESDYKRRQGKSLRAFVLGIDEADKASAPVAQLVRSVWTHCQQVGVRDVRFVVAGVSPLLQEMIQEDAGVARAFSRVLTLKPMTPDEARELLVRKLEIVINSAEQDGVQLGVHPDVIDRIVALSGGHPHIIQLLGSHLVEREVAHGDGVLGLDDLVGSLERVCYEDRGAAYTSTFHMLEAEKKLDSLSTLVNQVLTEPGFPTRIDMRSAIAAVGQPDVQWLVDHSILIPIHGDSYGLVDEFLRVRLGFDAEQVEFRADVEAELAASGRLLSWDEIQEEMKREEDTDGRRTR